MLINEDRIRKIIRQTLNESFNLNSYLRRLFVSQISDEIGFRGSIDNELHQMLDYVDYDDDYDIPLEERFNEKDFNFLSQVYSQYDNAMKRRREDSSLSFERFLSYILFHAYFFQYKDSFIFGQFTNGYFKVSHFAPKNIREGYEMLKEISEYDNIIFAVTEDLADMLQKIGLYGNSNATIPMFFRDELVMKHIYTTDKDLLNYFLDKIISDNFEKIDELLDNYDSEQDFRPKIRKGYSPNNYDNDEYSEYQEMPNKLSMKFKNRF